MLGSPPSKEKKTEAEGAEVEVVGFWRAPALYGETDQACDGFYGSYRFGSPMTAKPQARLAVLGAQRRSPLPTSSSDASSLTTAARPSPPLTAHHQPLVREDSLSEMTACGDPFLHKVMRVLRKLAGANTQLNVVSKYATRGTDDMKKEKDENAAKMQTLVNQLKSAQENLISVNTEFQEKIRSTAREQNASSAVYELLGFTVAVSNSSSFMVNCVKAVTVEVGDRDLYKQILQATRTCGDAMASVIDLLKEVTPSQQCTQGQLQEMKTKIQQSVTAVKQSTYQLVTAQAAIFGENFISPVRRQEILAGVKAAVAASTKLLWLRESGEGEEIVNSAKVTALTVSQLCAAVLEAANDDLMLAHADYRKLLTDAVSRTKNALSNYIEETKSIFSDKSMCSKDSSPEYLALRETICTIVAITHFLGMIGLANLDKNTPEVTEENRIFAKKVVDEVTPPAPPAPPVKDDKDCGENVVMDNNIWDEPGDNPSNIMLNEKDGRLRCATLNKLIEKITSPDSHDLRMLKSFITTYRSFTTPRELVTKLAQRYDVPPHLDENILAIQSRICNVLRLWTEAHIGDLNESELDTLSAFVTNKLTNDPKYEKFAERISTMIGKRRNSNTKEIVQQGLVEMKIEPKIPLSPSRLLSVFDEIQVARQLTLVDFSIYASIRPHELMNQAWNKPKLKHRSPNVLKLISRSTAISMWVASSILWQPTLKERTRILTKLINIADHLRRMNNFNSLMAVIAGLNTSSIYRLKHTREGLSPQTLKTFQACEQVMSNNQSFLNYRTTLHNVNPPCIPFLGVYLTDLTFADDANPDEINGLINFGKYELMYNIIEEIQQYQQISYTFEYVDHIASFLCELPQNSDKDMFELSKQAEPKGALKSEIL